MWPKAFAQLIELAPHISRLLPMADRFFQSKTNGDETTRKAVEALAVDLHGNLGEVTAAHTTLRKQIEDLSGKVGAVDPAVLGQLNGLGAEVKSLGSVVDLLSGKTDVIAADARGGRLAAESLEARLRVLESRQNRIFVLFAVTFLLLAGILVLLAMLLSHGR